MVKNSPFTGSELDLAKNRIAKSGAKVIAMPGGFVQRPYDSLFMISHDNNNTQRYDGFDPEKTAFELKPPTDNSPFYFAKEQIPSQMKLLLETVVGLAIVLILLLTYYSKVNRMRLTTSSTSLHIAFVIFIGFGFIFLEITFIQKFLLLLGTPIMALTVILFSILLSSGIGAYLSGKLFSKNPYRAVMISIPLLAAIIIIYYNYLSAIIYSDIVFDIYRRIAITFALLFPAGLLMGFQFPSITRMASSSSLSSFHSSSSSSSYSASPSINYIEQQDKNKDGESNTNKNDVTLLWGINIIASVIGTVITAISSMIIGFNGNLLIGLGLYLGSFVCAIAAPRIAAQKVRQHSQKSF
jgi:hypothetical protein